MSDELPAGSQNLEDDRAPATIEPSTPPAELPPAVPEEAGAVDVAGAVMVPLGALQEERAKRQALESKASRVDQLEQYVTANEPMLTLIKQYPDLLRRQAEPVVPVVPAEDPDALEAAQLLDFYTPDGKPDVAKGAKHLALVNRQAQRIATQAVAPMQQQSLQERANANFQLALGIKDGAGNPINRQALEAVWRQVQSSPNGTAILADREAAAFVASAAHGAVSLTMQPGIAAPLRPPVVTEGSGGGTTRRAPISELETRVAAERGRDAEHWGKLTKGHVAGRPNLVEE